MARLPVALSALALLAVAACAPTPPPPPPPPPVPVTVVTQPVIAAPPPVSTTPMAAPEVDPVVDDVTMGQLIDLDDDSDVIGLDTDTAQPMAPVARPRCLPSLETSGDPVCQSPDVASDTDLDVDTTIEVQPVVVDD